MAATTYTASKTRSKRPGWSITFRHPLRHDARGKPGLKIRRGLGTADNADADRMVEEMNALLADPSWWNTAKRQEAASKFSKPVVAAFYDEIQAGREDPAELRQQLIPIPGRDDGYTRVLLVGTTGAGKTTLLRQLIGSDPDKDRFPSTAPAKTTISDIEVVQADGDFAAVVTFISEFQAQASIEECIADACLAALENAPDEKLAERFLNHRNQKFRLSYILGAWRIAAQAEDEEDWSFDAGEQQPSLLEAEAIPEQEVAQNRAALEGYVNAIRSLAIKVSKEVSKELGEDIEHLTGDDRDAALELLEEGLYSDSSFNDLVQDVLEDVRRRFDHLTAGNLSLSRSNWPQVWSFTTADRDDFIRQIRWFSSNFWPQFGRLLTPLVDGIRVRGPLYPAFSDAQPKLVLIDGQGLGHTPESSMSVTTHITRRFGEVDVILLVDNAQQPVQAAPLAVLRYVAASGHHRRLAIAFSHFDQIKGANLKSLADKKGHVMASVMNALSSLRDDLGSPVINALERSIDERCFMLGNVDQTINALPNKKAAEYMRGEFGRMIGFFKDAIIPPPPPVACPIYDPTGLGFAVREAVTKFMGPWLARLGLSTYDRVHREHWTRIRALNRRIASELDVEYDTLRPVADLVARMSEAISRFLDNPTSWTRAPQDEKEAQDAIAPIRQEVASGLHTVAKQRLIDQSLQDWRKAYALQGVGSSVRRTQHIRAIYEGAAPLPDAIMTQATAEFLVEIRQLVQIAINAHGGKVQLTAVA